MQPTQSIDDHCREIDGCNQRGGRMLSIVDLLEAGTFEPDVAAYCTAAISSGASFLTAASPGGVGKTTIMGALLNFVPADVVLRPAAEPLRRSAYRECWIGHEIGPGRYYGYLWGEPLRRWFRLADEGAMLASNIHADTMEEIEDQLIGQNGVPREHLWRIGFVAFIRLSRSVRNWTPRIASVWECDGACAHRLLWDAIDGWKKEPGLVATQDIEMQRARLQGLVATEARTIAEVRAALLRDL